MSASVWILTAGFAALVILGVPFVFAIGLVVVAVITVADIPSMLLPQTMVAGTQSFSLLGIPFFMLAGELMSAGGLSRRLIAVADVCVRHLLGGLGHVTIVAACIFAAISGSAPATTAAIGSAMIPAMAERGYSRPYATSLAVSAGVLAPLIPPSIAFIIWGVIAEQSIAQLFLAGVIPGLIMAIGLSTIVIWRAHRDRIPQLPRATAAEVRRALRQGVWALLAPVIVLGGIYGGVFTPTEAAAAACVYAAVVETLVYRQMSPRELFRLSQTSSIMIATLMIVISMGSAMTWYLTLQQAPAAITSILADVPAWAVLAVVNVLFLIAGMFIDPNSAVIIMAPLIAPAAAAAGLDPVHVGAVIVFNLAIGMVTPPFGLNLFIGITTFRASYVEVVRAALPFIVLALVTLLLITYIPSLVLWLPSLVQG